MRSGSKRQRSSTNEMAQLTRDLFKADADLMTHFNKVLSGGKWDHFQDQAHIGYTSWRDPPENSLAAVKLSQLTVPMAPSLGVAIDGSATAWPGAAGEPTLPELDSISQQRSYIDVFNRSQTAFPFTAATSVPWIRVSETTGTVARDRRLWVTVDWERAPSGKNRGVVTVTGAG